MVLQYLHGGTMSDAKEKVWLKLYKRYSVITKYLVEICDIARNVDPNLSTQNCLREFDRILQAILFFQSKVNHNLYPKEIQFLNGVAGDADILELVNKKLYSSGMTVVKKITWDNVFSLDDDMLSKVEETIKEFCKEYTRNTAAYMAIAEYISGKNFYDKVSDNIVELLCAFASLEKGMYDAEIQQGILAYCELVAESYIEIKGNTEEIFANNKVIQKELIDKLRQEFKKSKKTEALQFIEGKLQVIRQKIIDFFK